MRLREAEATSATAPAPQGPLQEVLPDGERVPVGLRLSPGTRATPALPGPRRLPIQPGSFCLVQFPRNTAAPAPAPPDAAGGARRTSAPLEECRSPGAAARGAAAKRGRGGALEAHGPSVIGRADCTDANFYWLAVAWGRARGGRAGSGRSDWCTSGAGHASLGRAGVGVKRAERGGRSRGGGPAQAGTGGERARAQGKEKQWLGETIWKPRLERPARVPPRPERVPQCSRLRRK